MSQIALADRIGLHFTFVSSVERGDRNLSLASLLRLADGLQMNPGRTGRRTARVRLGDGCSQEVDRGRGRTSVNPRFSRRCPLDNEGERVFDGPPWGTGPGKERTGGPHANHRRDR